VGRPERKNPLGRPRRRWEGTIFRKRDRDKDWRLRVFENRLLRRIFKPKSDEGAEEWRRQPN
jgi:hypothetical protein